MTNNSNTIILMVDDTEIIHNCYECGKTFENYTQVILHYIDDTGIIYFHLNCWLPFLFTTNYERILTMTDKTPSNKTPNINEMMERNKPWDYTHSEVLDKLLVINSFTEIETGYGDALLADCVVNEQPAKVLIGGVFLIQALKNVKDRLPVSATIVKEGTYYRFQ